MLNFDLPKNHSSIIKVVGVGGGGNNAVNHMFKQGIKDVDFINCNTDAQVLEESPVPTIIQLGERGRGAGAKPDVGREAAESAKDDLIAVLETNTEMLFITAGMGGGTGTGAAPVIAELAKELGILTVGIVTYPFAWEGKRRKLQADKGLEEMRKSVDTLLIINNNKIREMYGNQAAKSAFNKADDILAIAAKSIAEIITVRGYVNVDFEDVKEVMKNSGTAIMGTGLAEGPNRAIDAVEQALSSPLLNDSDIHGAKNLLLYISSGTEELTMDEMSDITEYVQDKAGMDADLIWGNGDDETLGNAVSVSLIATGFDNSSKSIPEQEEKKTIIIHDLKKPVDSTPVVAEPKDAQPKAEISLVNTPVKQEESTKVVKNVSIPKISDSVETAISEPTLISRSQSNPENEIKPVILRKVEPLGDENSFNEGEMERRSNDRASKLRRLSVNLRSADNLEELENQPAYVRKKVVLENAVPSNESVISRYSLTGDNITDNSFLHNNVD